MHSSARFAWRVLWQGVLAAFAILQLTLLAGAIRQAPDRPYLDFFTFLRSGLKVRARQPIYVFDTVTIAPGRTNDIITLQHPIVAVIFAPLSTLDPLTAYWLWFGISLAAWSLAVAFTLRATTPPPAWRLPLILLAITLSGLHWDLIHGQVGCIMALLSVAGWLLVRRQRWFAAGVVVGILAVLKVFLVPLALPLLLRGRGRAAGGLILGAAAPALVTLPWTGWRAFPDWLAALRGVYWLDVGGNLSFHAYLTRALGAVPPSWMVVGLSLLTVAVGLSALYRPVAGMPDTERLYGGLIAVGILGSPLGWGNYTLFLLPLWGVLLQAPLEAWRRRTVLIAIALLWLPDLGTGLGTWLDSLHTLGLILFVVVLSASPLPSLNRATNFLTRRRPQPV